MLRAARVFPLLFVAAGSASAQPYPSLTAFPLELKRAPASFTAQDDEDLRAEFERLLRKAGADVPDSAQYAQALRELKRQDCDRDDECLKQLAQLARTLYAMYVQVDHTLAGKVVAMGRVVRSDGVPMGRTRTVSLPLGKRPFAEVAGAALEQLLAELGVKDLPPQRTVQPDAPRVDAAKPPPGAGALTPPPAAPPPEAPPPALVERPGKPGLRRYAWAPGVVAGLSAVGAGVTWGLGLDAHQQLATRTFSSGAEPERLAQRGEALQLAAALSAGAALAAAGVLVWFLAVGDEPPVLVTPSAPAALPSPAPGVVAW